VSALNDILFFTFLAVLVALYLFFMEEFLLDEEIWQKECVITNAKFLSKPAKIPPLHESYQ